MSANPYSIHVEASGPLGGYIAAPPSKNYSTRYILAAALAEGESMIRRPATNDDARALIACCRLLGAAIEEENGDLRIRGVAGRPRNPGRLNPGNAGAVLRLLLGVACLIEGEVEFVTDYPDSLGKRPNEELLRALRELGAEAAGRGDTGLLPITIAGGRQKIKNSIAHVSGNNSSQFLSALLFLAPYLDHDTLIRVTPVPFTPAYETFARVQAGIRLEKPMLVSVPLVHQTLEVLQNFGVTIETNFNQLEFRSKGNQVGKALDTTVNADWPSAAALMSCVAAASGMATLYGLQADAQGERRAEEYLTALGCKFHRPRPGELIVHSKGELRAADFNGDLATDAVPALVAAACLAEGTSRFAGIGNLRIKECDRIREPLEELEKLGVKSRSGPDWMEITGNPEGYRGGIEVDSRGDHRVAQLLAIVGTRCEQGLTIRRAEHISKSYPGFFEDLTRLGVKLRRIEG